MKQLGIKLLVALGIILAILQAYQCRRLKELKDSVKSKDNTIEELMFTSRQFKDKDGKNHTIIESKEIDRRDAVKIPEVKKALNHFVGVNKKAKNVSSIQIANEIIRDTVYIPKEKIVYNSCNNFVISDSYNDGYTYVQVDCDSSGCRIISEITDTIESITYTKRKWLLGKVKVFSEIRNANPKAKYYYKNSIRIKK